MLPLGEGSTRKELIHLLRTSADRSISELSQALGLTEMGVRRHVQAMERDGLIEAKTVRQTMGRPTARYSLTARADDLFPKNYPQLTLDLLGELADADQAPLIDQLFEGRRDKLAAKYRERMSMSSLEGQVAELAAIQQAGGYMCEWEKNGSDSFLLYEYNCPISQVAGQYRQACRCEQQLFEQLLPDAKVERTECLADGGRRCTYAIRSVRAEAITNN